MPAPSPAPGKRYTVKDAQSGKTITFLWNGAGEPGDSDFEDVFREASRSAIAAGSAPKSDSVANFLSELWGGTIGGAKNVLFGSPDEPTMETPLGTTTVAGPAQRLFAAASTGSEDQFSKMLEAAKRGQTEGQQYALGRWQLPGEEPQMALPKLSDYEVMGRAAAGAIPLIGPAAAGVGEAIGENRPWTAAGRAAALGAGLHPGAVARGAGRALSGAARTVSKTGSVGLGLAAKAGIPGAGLLKQIKTLEDLLGTLRPAERTAPTEVPPAAVPAVEAPAPRLTSASDLQVMPEVPTQAPALVPGAIATHPNMGTVEVISVKPGPFEGMPFAVVRPIDNPLMGDFPASGDVGVPVSELTATKGPPAPRLTPGAASAAPAAPATVDLMGALTDMLTRAKRGERVLGSPSSQPVGLNPAPKPPRVIPPEVQARIDAIRSQRTLESQLIDLLKEALGR